MTNLVERPAVMSAVSRSLTTEEGTTGAATTGAATTEEGVNTMSATVYGHQYSTAAPRRARPHGLDRLVMRLSLAMLLWARRRADRAQPSYEEHSIRRATALALERERHVAATRIARVF